MHASQFERTTPARIRAKVKETFTAEVIRAVISRQNGRGVVFLAWGLPAQKTCDRIGIVEVH